MEKKYGCDDHYRIATALYLLSMLSQEFSIITNCVIRAPGHNREVFDGLNDAKKRFLFQWMSTVQLLDEKCYDTHMVMHTVTRKSDVSLASEFQKYLSTAAHKHGVID